MIRTTFALVTAFCLSLSPLSAATVTTTSPDLNALSATSLDLPTGSSWTAAPDMVAGSVGGVYRSPFEGLGAGQFGRIQYWNVGGGDTALLNLGWLRGSLSLLWGSPDTYNTLKLINSGTGAFQTIIPALNGTPGTVTTTLVTISGFAFDRVEFKSNSPALEFSNVSVASVPVPAAGLMLLLALGGLAALRQRKAAI
jgi:hypothetical protein